MGLLSGIGKAFSGVGNLVGGIIGPSVGGLLNDFTGVTDTANRSFNDQIKLWNMQNEYNTPSAQIARMADAGIDINPMTYAVGNGSMDTKASSIGSPSYSGSGINPIASAMSVVQGIKGMQLQDSEKKIMDHNLKIAQDLNMPVGQVPLLYGQGQGVKSVVDDFKDLPDKLIDKVTNNSNGKFGRLIGNIVDFITLRPFRNAYRDYQYRKTIKSLKK